MCQAHSACQHRLVGVSCIDVRLSQWLPAVCAEGWHRVMVGTPEYEAPEVSFAAAAFACDQTSALAYQAAAAEVFSVGMTLFHLLIGRLPWRRQSRPHEGAVQEVALYHLHQVAAVHRPAPPQTLNPRKCQVSTDGSRQFDTALSSFCITCKAAAAAHNVVLRVDLHAGAYSLGCDSPADGAA